MHLSRTPALALVVLLSLAGCQTIGGWFDTDESDDPAELVEFSPTIQVEQVWSTSVGHDRPRSLPRLQPLHDGDRIWTVDSRGLVSATDASNGGRILRFDTELEVSAGPAVYDDRLYLGTFGGIVHALNSENGATQWSAQLSSEILSLPVLHDGVLIVRCLDGRVFGLDPADGRRIWVHDRNVPALTLRGNSDTLVRAGQAFIGYDDGNVTALRVGDGGRIWEQPVSTPEGRTELDRLADIDGAMAMVGSDLYVATYRDRLAAIATESGRILWVKDVASATGISFSRTRLALTDRDDNLWLVDRRNGATLWREDSLLRRKLTRPGIVGDYVVVGDLDGYLHWFGTDDGKIAARVRAFRDGFAAPPLVVGDMVYLLSDEGDLSAWRIRS